VKPGKHNVVLSARGTERGQQVDVAPGGFATVALTALQ
jgi:hypothetical protein